MIFHGPPHRAHPRGKACTVCDTEHARHARNAARRTTKTVNVSARHP